ncbi:MAG: phenylalanine--tRNA ligase subunit beta [Bacteroidia bacterium]
MRILWSWLSELVELAISPEGLADLLTRAGLEVEGISAYRRLSEHLQHILVGEVLRVERHPEADQLWVAEVGLGNGRAVTVVTRFPNLRVSQRVAVAPAGALVQLNGEWRRLEPRRFRGILSEALLCSPKELGLGESEDTLFTPPPTAPLGATLAAVLPNYEDWILEISPTPNRGDALSHWGIAREYHALTGAPLRLPQPELPTQRLPFPYQLVVESPEACPRYGGIYLEGLEGPAHLPTLWQYRLEALGVRLVHPIVDVTNYLLLGYGQPLHAFDAEALQGSQLRIYPLTAPAVMEGLHGETLALAVGDIVIADAEGPACLAGLLGGKRTAISSTTARVFIESAYFAPSYIRRTGRRLGLQTESGYRFMRGTDPRQVPWAAEMAADLLLRLYPQARCSVYHEVHEPTYTASRRVLISLPKLEKLLGTALASDQIAQYLARLDIRVEPLSPTEWRLEVPRYRLDVTRPADIAEEVLRFLGWASLPLPAKLPAAPLAEVSAADRTYALCEKVAELLNGLGFQEIRTNSLVGAAHFPHGVSDMAVRLHNPLYEELAYLRPTLIGSGLAVIAHNRNHGALGFWAFEWGRVYSSVGEELRLGLWGWGRPPLAGPAASVEAKAYFLATLRALLRRLGIPYTERPIRAEPPWQQAIGFYLQGQPLGVAGLIEPSYLHRFGLKDQLVMAAEFLPSLLQASLNSLPTYKPLFYAPVVVKDLSLYVPPALTYAEIEAALWRLESPYLLHVESFDWYQDEEGRVSYGIRLYLQGAHTLSEKEIHAFLSEAIAQLEKLGATVRKA